MWANKTLECEEGKEITSGCHFFRDLGVWLAKWQARYPKLCNWVEENIEETLTFYRWPLAVEIHEDWIEQHRYLNMELLREHKKLKLVQAA